MFQAAIVALERIGLRSKGEQWSHENLQATFAEELIHRRKQVPRRIASFLPNGMRLRHEADYYDKMVSEAQAQRALRWAREFLNLLQGG
jgi:hypothetical protein